MKLPSQISSNLNLTDEQQHISIPPGTDMAQHSPKLIVSQLSTHPQKGPHTAKPDRDAGPPLPALLEPQLGDLGTFWTSFDRATDDYDKDMLDALKASMDNLLIFVSESFLVALNWTI